jgi:hypothetical protein
VGRRQGRAPLSPFLLGVQPCRAYCAGRLSASSTPSLFRADPSSSACDATGSRSSVRENAGTQPYFVPWQSVYIVGARLRAIENERERAARKAARRGGRP